MTAIIHERTENERLARLEATVEALVSEFRDRRSAERAHFFWILGILLGVIVPTIIGLLVSLMTLILRLQ